MKSVKNFWLIMDTQTLIVTLLALGSTYLCRVLGFQANMPTALISVAIIFPIVFSINAAYRRREEALKYFASLKAHSVSLYFTHKHWAPNDNEAHGIRAKRLFESLFKAVETFFVSDGAKRDQQFQNFYKAVAEISASHEQLRADGLPGNEVSRANQYLRAIMIEFERMKNILEYRTPLLLRAYSHVFLNSFPILFGPYFAHVIDKSYAVVGYGVAIVYSLVLVSLDNIQEHLENPFDQGCEDDVNLDVFDAYDKMMSSDL